MMTRDYAAPDWRGLCEELVEEWDAATVHVLGAVSDAIDRARAALAQPEPEVVGPSDEELLELYPATMVDQEDAFAFARAVLARWGRPAPAPAGERQAAPVPVPVSERLPGAEDCDAEGRCWWWYPPVPEQTYGYWIFEDNAVPERSRLEWPESWLPAHALPLPSGEAIAAELEGAG